MNVKKYNISIRSYQGPRSARQCTTRCCVVISRMGFRAGGGWRAGKGVQFHYRSGSAPINHQGRRRRTQVTGVSWAWYSCFIPAESHFLYGYEFPEFPRRSTRVTSANFNYTDSEKLLQLAPCLKYWDREIIGQNFRVPKLSVYRCLKKLGIYFRF